LFPYFRYDNEIGLTAALALEKIPLRINILQPKNMFILAPYFKNEHVNENHSKIM